MAHGLHGVYADNIEAEELHQQAQPAVATAAMQLAHYLPEPQLLTLTQAALTHAVHAVTQKDAQASDRQKQGQKDEGTQHAATASWVVTTATSLTDALLKASCTASSLSATHHASRSQATQAELSRQGFKAPPGIPKTTSALSLTSQSLTGNQSASGMAHMQPSSQAGGLQGAAWETVVAGLVDMALAGVHAADSLLVEAVRIDGNPSIAHAFDRLAFM